MHTYAHIRNSVFVAVTVYNCNLLCVTLGQNERLLLGKGNPVWYWCYIAKVGKITLESLEN